MAVPRRHKTRRSTWFLPGALSVLVLTIASGLFLAPASSGTAVGPSDIMGNDANNRPLLDGWRDMAIVDRNNTATVGAVLTSFDYYARNTNPFNILVVNAANEVTWVSPSVVPPATGTQTFTPASPVAVAPGDALGLYFPAILQPTVPYEYAGAEGLFTAKPLGGLPTVGQTLVKYPAGDHARKYSIVGHLSCYAVCYVNQITGDDTNDGLSPATPLATIQEGVDRVMDGGEVIVAPGVYVENVVIEDPVTLTGPNAGIPGAAPRGPEATIDGDYNDDTVHIHDPDGVTVNGFRIINGYYDNVAAHDAANVSIINNIIRDSDEDAVDFSVIDGGTIGANLITGTGYNSVYVSGGFDIVVRDNVIRDNGDEDPVDITDVIGLQVLRNIIKDNSCEYCDAAVEIDQSQNVLVAENEIEEFSDYGDGDALEFDGYNIGVTVRNNYLAGWDDAIDIDGYDNEDFNVFQNHFGDTNDSGIELNDSDYYISALLMAERNWWGAADGPGGDGPGSGVDLDDYDGEVDFHPWLCLGTDTSPAIGFQPNLAAVSPCDATKPVWTATWSKWAQGPGTYTPGTWSNVYVVLTFQCTDEPGGSGIASKRGDLEVVFNDDGTWNDTDPIIGPEGSIKGDASDEYCIDNAGNVADPIDPLTAGQTVKVDTKAPVCKPANGTIRLKKNQTHVDVTNVVNGSDATSGFEFAVGSVSEYGGASYANIGFVGTAPNLAVELDVTFPNSTASGVKVYLTMFDFAGNSSTCNYTIRAK